MEQGQAKITIRLDRSIVRDLNKTVPRGLRGHLVSAALRLITGAIKRDGDIMLGAIIAGQYRLVLDMGEEKKRVKA